MSDDQAGLWELMEDFRTAAEGTPFVKKVDAEIREIVVNACMEDDALYARFIALGEARKSETESPAGALTAEKAALLPCPFCGSPAEVEAYTPSRSVRPEGPRVGYIASCTNDDCDAELSITTYNKIATIAAWNRRAVNATALQVRSSEAASQLPPSSARERRMEEALERLAGLKCFTDERAIIHLTHPGNQEIAARIVFASAILRELDV